MTDLIFRSALRSDVPAIVGLLADDPIGAGRETVTEEIDAAYWQAFDALDGDPRNTVVVAVVGGSVVGTMQLILIPSLTRRGALRMEIEGVRVAAAHRGAGLGRRMISWAVSEARASGCALVQLTTDKRRSEARRFYESLGFSATHEGMKLAL
ncbi:acetyltransferase [Asanoa ishikariensis]|uniref:Acetyltransferase (GNAT) family protein n=1 Tax=Asanoa ishikariensis TaxID=137265 RepID=A0A1H3RSD1_9ACTN|nr:GNAT family N-acetyltransferase [Asanoa ishikariensis]GIF66877.1 acetyltransferase [Asanoa ishikariensis]SDZ28684.1 Acetyltransferase (GNAT) family protein [Asanoa ishikariensis]